MEKISIFRYKYDWYNEMSGKSETSTGFVAGTSYGDAANRLVAINTSPKGESTLFSMELWEVDCYDAGVLEDCIIKEIYEEEDNK